VPGVRWQASPWALLAGRVGARLSAADDSALRGRFRLGRNSVELLDVRLTLPADLATLAAAVAAFAPTGSLALEIGAVRWAPPGSTGSGTLNWRNARLSAPADGTPIGLGNVRLDFQAAGDQLTYSFGNEGGDVGVDGEGTWQPGSAVKGSARIRENAGASDAASAALARLGQRAADGTWTLRFPVGAAAGGNARR